MKKILFLIIILVVSCGVASAQSLEDIQWLAEEYPPYSFKNSDGTASGFNIDIMLKIWEKVGLKKTSRHIDFVPWARAVTMLDKYKYVCIVGMGINDERKKKYRFVGRVLGAIRGLIAKKEKSYVFNSIADINRILGKNGLVGVVRSDIGEKNFLQHGGDPKLIHRSVKGIHMVKILEQDRVDLIAYSDVTAFKLMKKLGFNHRSYEVVFTFSQGTTGFAFNKDADPAVLQQLQKAFDELEADGTVLSIRNYYINE